jgi:hypothetical protein
VKGDGSGSVCERVMMVMRGGVEDNEMERRGRGSNTQWWATSSSSRLNRG